MEAHEWMIKPTRQTEWIDKRGLFLWLAFYTGGLGGGLYLVSLYFNSLLGIIVSWLIISVLKGGFHIVFLGKPWRFWRIVSRPHSSWLSRGLIFVVSFVVLGAIQIIISILLPGTVLETIFKILTGAMAFGTAIYTGFILNNVKAIPFWNSPLLPIIFLMCGLLGGFGLMIVFALCTTNTIDIGTAETGSRLLLIINVLLIMVYLWRASKKGVTSRQSVLEQIYGNASAVFWIGVIALGTFIPLGVAFFSYFHHGISTLLLLIGVVCEIIGGMALRYCILKVGIYQPLLSTQAYDDWH